MEVARKESATITALAICLMLLGGLLVLIISPKPKGTSRLISGRGLELSPKPVVAIESGVGSRVGPKKGLGGAWGAGGGMGSL